MDIALPHKPWMRLADLVVNAGFAPSRSAAKRLMAQGAVSVQFPGDAPVVVRDPLAIVVCDETDGSAVVMDRVAPEREETC